MTGVQLCCAHLMRDLQAVWEADPQGQAWAAQMRQTLTKARRAVDAAVGLPPGTLAALRDLYANTAEHDVAANAPGVKGRSKEAYKLAKRIDQALYFSIDFDVDWTNNSCEQTIRMAKLQAKISGSWRSMRGLKAFCRIRSLHRYRPGARHPRLHRAARRLPRQPLEHPSNRVTASVNPRDQGLP